MVILNISSCTTAGDKRADASCLCIHFRGVWGEWLMQGGDYKICVNWEADVGDNSPFSVSSMHESSLFSDLASFYRQIDLKWSYIPIRVAFQKRLSLESLRSRCWYLVRAFSMHHLMVEGKTVKQRKKGAKPFLL